MLRAPQVLEVLPLEATWPAPLAPRLLVLGQLLLPPLLLGAPAWSVPRSLPPCSRQEAHLVVRPAAPPWWTLSSLLLRLLLVGVAAPCILLASVPLVLWGVLVLARSPRAPTVALVADTVALAWSVLPPLPGLPRLPQARQLWWRQRPLLPSPLPARLLQPLTALLLQIVPSAPRGSALQPPLTPRVPTLSTSVAWCGGLRSATAPAPCAGMGPSLRRPSISPIPVLW